MSNADAVAAALDSVELEGLAAVLAEAVRTLAAQVDSDPGDSGLWREYRQHAMALQEAMSGGSDDDTAEFLASVSVLPAVGDGQDR